MTGRIGSTLQSSPAVTCMKLLLTIFNFLFWVSGVAILALGIWMKMELYMYIELTSVYYEFAPYILIGIGAGIVLFGSFGCFCTIKGHGRLLYIFAIVLILVFFIELATAVAIFITERINVEGGFGEGLDKAMDSYATDVDKRKAMDGLQTRLKCCGKTNYEDWYNVTWTKDKGLQRKVPHSCCQDPSDTTCDVSGTKDINQEGCLVKVMTFLGGNSRMIGGIVLGLSFLQLLGAMLTCCLAKNINKARYEQVD